MQTGADHQLIEPVAFGLAAQHGMEGIFQGRAQIIQFGGQAIGPLQLWITAYCNDVFGYFPSARVLREGGYECRGLYTTNGFFAPSAQDLLVAKIRELAQRAGRALP